MTDSVESAVPNAARPSTSRMVALLVGAAIAAPCVGVALLALRIPAPLAYVSTVLLVGIGTVVANAKAPASLASLGDGSRALFLLWLVLAGAAIYRVSSLAMFVDDPARSEFAFTRTSREVDDPELTKPFYPKHNCSTCYIVAAHLASVGEPNLYDRKHYRDAEVETPIHETIGETFNVDQYQYPPPFLLGPYLALASGLDFFQLRALWFGFSVLLFVLTSGALTVWICGWRFNALWLIWPAVLITPALIGSLQTGNAHVFMVLSTVLALLLFEKNRNALGGTLLAYATLSKLFPGLLIVYLLFRRNMKAFAWTVAACVGLSLVTLTVFGTAPYRAFLGHQLPGIASGDAFWFAFERPGAMLANSSVTGLLYKLKGMGLAGAWDPRIAAVALTWVYTGAVLAIAAIVARRHAALVAAGSGQAPDTGSRLFMVRAWVALIVLAQLRSPFLPNGYGNAAVLILLTLMLTIERTTVARLVAVGVGICIFAVLLPLPIGPPTVAFDFGFSLFTSLLAIALAMTVGLRRCRPPTIGSTQAKG